SASGIVFDNVTYQIIRIKTVETFLLVANGTENLNASMLIRDEFNNTFLNDSTAIQNILKQYYKRFYPSESEINETLNSVNEFNATRDKRVKYGNAESSCKTYLGIDKKPCYDSTTCINSCLAVYLCKQVMYGAGTTFLNAMVSYATAVQQLDGNMTALYASLERLKAPEESDDVYAILASSLENVDNVRTLSSTIKTNKLVRGDCGDCLDFCPPTAINPSLLDAARTRLLTLKNRVPQKQEISTAVSSIQARTAERMDYILAARQRRMYEARYAELLAEREAVGKDIAMVADVFNTSLDVTAKLDDVLARIANVMNVTRNYSEFGALLQEYNTTLNKTRSEIYAYLGRYENITSLSAEADDVIVKAGWVVTPDAAALAELDGIKKQKTETDALVVLPLNIDNVSAIEEGYAGVISRSNGLIDAHARYTQGDVGAFVGRIFKRASDNVIAIIGMITPMSVAQRRDLRPAIPPVLILAVDVLLILLAGVLFVIGVTKGLITLHRTSRIAWAIVFLLLIILVGGSSLAVYMQLAALSGDVSLSAFLEDLGRSDRVALVKDISGLGDAEVAAIDKCGGEIHKIMGEKGKFVSNYTIDGGLCIRGSDEEDEIPSELCYEFIEDTPMFYIRGAEANKTTFRTFYEKRADIAGDVEYLEKCYIAKVIK
ncbi:MAG: hypothetical protein AB1468_04710, partial [Candidatus Micrarchaeota archaeon]